MTDDPRDAPTPRTSQSWAFFLEATRVLIARLEKAFSMLKIDERFEARRLIGELRGLEKRFEWWPLERAEIVAMERQGLTAKLVQLNGETEKLLSS